MDIDQLKQIVIRAGEGKFELSTDELNSEAVRRVSNDFLPANKLRLDAASVEQPPPADAITVRGTGVDLPFKGMEVEVVFYIEGGAAAFRLTATGDAKWTLAKGFPPLEGTIGADLTFTTDAPNHPPQLFLQTHAANDRPRDLFFEGVLNLDEKTGGLASIVGGQFEPVRGSIVLKQEGSKFYDVELAGPVTESVDLGIATVEKLTFKVGSRLYAYNATEKYASPFIEMAADFAFETKRDGKRKIPIVARATTLDLGFRFQADLSQAIDTAIEDLKDLTKGHGLSDLLPERPRLSEFLKLKEFFFDFNPKAEHKVSFIGIRLESTEPWTVLHIAETKQDLAVENVQLMFVVREPFGTSSKSLSISGEFAFGKAGRLVASMRYPGWVIRAYLKENTKLNLKEAVGVFKSSTTHVPEMEVDQLELEVSTAGFIFNLELKGQMFIPDMPFGLERAGVTIKSASSTYSFRGVLLLGGVAAGLSAEYPGSGAGWNFTGSTGPGQQIPIGHLITDLAQRFGDLKMPSAIDSFVIENLVTTFKTKTKEYSFSCEGKFRADDTDVNIKVDLAVTGSGATYSREITGKLQAGELDFKLHFVRQGASNSFVATYQPVTSGRRLNVKQLVGSISQGVANYVPSGLDIELKDVIFAYRKTTQDGSSLVFGFAIGTGINLSNLPLVGQKLPTEATVAVDNLQVLFNSKALTKREVDSFNELIPNGITRLPAPTKADEPQASRLLLAGNVTTDVLAAEPVLIEKGFVVSALMNFGGSQRFFSLSGVRRDSGLRSGAGAVSADAPATDNVKWFPLQKTFGPVYFDKVGVQYEAATVRFLLNAGLSAAGLTLSLDGLSIGSSLSQFKPEFELRGLGIDYKAGDIEIGGAFLRTITAGKPDRYDGAAVIKTKQFAVSALGSYTTLEGEPSLFIYAFVDYPLGGPAFFFITGLAAGFGYNRRLIAPSVEKAAEFPLVKQAIEGKKAKPKDVMAALTSLQSHVPPNVGSIFLAVGVKFNSFKLIDSFALLTIEFGNSLAINLIGLSKAVVPTPVKVAGDSEASKPVTPLAQVEIAWKATYNPDDGCLGIDARLTPNSYILSKDCHLSGGYAFYSWFTGPHAGDFVQTLGGYHPKFDVPSHYPKVPRLAFDWRVNNSLTIQGDAYYALTGSALMAGGHLEVLFKEGELRAWLKLGADFLIAWKPYHYDAAMYVSVGASYTFNINLLFTRVRVTISVEVGASLHLWGPDFSGTAKIDLSVISFTIAFGAGASQAPKAIEKWTEFEKSFLPAKEDVCTISVKSGLVRTIPAKGKESERWVINPKQFSLVIDSAIPIKSMGVRAEKLEDANIDFGIAPMAVRNEKPPGTTDPNIRALTDSNLTIVITKNRLVSGEQFKYSLVKKLVPAGLWGESATPTLTGTKFLEDVATGIEITPADAPAAGETKKIDVEVFKFRDEPHPEVFTWQGGSKFVPSDKKIADSVVSNRQRDALMSELGFQFGISIAKTVADDFLTAPQIGTLEPCQRK